MRGKEFKMMQIMILFNGRIVVFSFCVENFYVDSGNMQRRGGAEIMQVPLPFLSKKIRTNRLLPKGSDYFNLVEMAASAETP